MIAKSLEPILKLAEKIGRRLARDTKGQDLIEYAMLAGFVSVAAMAFFPTSIAPAIKSILDRCATLLTAASAS